MAGGPPGLDDEPVVAYTHSFYFYPITAVFTVTADGYTFSSNSMNTTTRNGQSCYNLNLVSENSTVTATVVANGQTNTYTSTGSPVDVYLNQSYVSNLSDGTTTYIIKDEEAHQILDNFDCGTMS